MDDLKTFKSFKPGDVVMLSSGGFPMTVTQGTNHEGLVQTSWFAFNDLKHSGFPANALDVTTLRFDPAKGTVE
jgi:uncharacterized protein YodC (DUF2158 family)